MDTGPNLVATQMLAEARAEVAQADTKASLLLAALGVGFGLVLGGQLSGDWSPDRLSDRGEQTWWLGAAFAASSVIAAAAAVWPRFHAEDLRSGIAYWGHVAIYDDLDSFRAGFEQKMMDMADRTIHQLWHLARLVQRKYSCIRWAIGLAGVSAALIGIATFIP